MIAKGDSMNNKLKITITEHQRDLLIKHVEPYILDEETVKSISTVISKNGKCHFYLNPEDLENLIGNCCFVANHEKKNKDLVLELDDLIDYMEGVLNEG